MHEMIPIHHKIYTLRGKQIMIDSDLAALYQVETRRLNEQVKRNSTRFPDDFMFQLTEKEFANFLNIAHASTAEVQSHLYIVLDQKYIDKTIFNKLYEECTEISKMMLGFQNYLRKL